MKNTRNTESNSPTDHFLSHWLLKPTIWILLITIAVGFSLYFNHRHLALHTLSLALERGRYTFKIIESTRLWVAQHGVAYVAKTEKVPSNPYLDIPEKNIKTPSGVELTAVNPAYMTRLLAEILKTKHDLFVHLTSLKPLNPGNKADPWETKSLNLFENDETTEVIEIIKHNNDDYVRFMAHLYVKPACMKCHKKQGYEVGDIRGGISVSFDYGPFVSATADQYRIFHLIHFVAWITLSIFSIVTLKLIKRHESIIKKSRDDAELLVQRKTKELRKEVKIRRGAEAKMNLLINATEEGIFGVDNKGRITFINSAGLHLLGFSSSDQVINMDEHTFIHHTSTSGLPFDSADCQIHAAWKLGLSGHSEDEVFWRADGSSFPVEYHVHPINVANKIVGAVINFSNISVRKELQNTIWHQANYDNLTGVANRSLLLDRLEHAIEQSKRGQFKLALLFIDLNKFKPINDNYGHDAGDEVLITTARRIKAKIRKNDTIARLGGDEFVVILNQIVQRGEATNIAKNLSLEIQKSVNIGATSIEVSASIGISVFPDDAEKADQLITKADQDMYRNKVK